MNKAYEGYSPWALTYSYGRALQNAAMSVWRGNPKNVKNAQLALLKRCELNTLAAQGKYKPKFEK
jgi:fructose-bisphosphate aldolase class I